MKTENATGSRISAVRAFSIIELLAAMAVFLLVAVAVATIVSSTAQVSGLARGKIRAEGAANQAFDRMTADFSRSVLRASLPDRIEKVAGNDILTFYARVDAYAGDRGISKVSYKVEDGNLLRGAEGFSWSDTGSLSQLRSMGTTPDSPSNPTATAFIETLEPQILEPENFESLGPGVFRIEYCFLLKDGTLSTVPVMQLPGVSNVLAATTSPDNTATGYAVGSRWFRPTSESSASRAFICVDTTTTTSTSGTTETTSTWKRLGWNDVYAIVVGIAVLDPESRRAFADVLTPAKLDEMAQAFPAAVNGKDILEAWNGASTTAQPDWEQTIQGLGLPSKILEGISVRQQSFRIGN